MVGYQKDKVDLLLRLRKVEGQVRGIFQMVEDERYCIDVLTQVAAATKALHSVGLGLFDAHLRQCVADAVALGESDVEAKLTEVTAAVDRLLKA